MKSGDSADPPTPDPSPPPDQSIDMGSLETATEQLLERTRRQAAELSRLIDQLEQLQGDIRHHHETRGRRTADGPEHSAPFAHDE